MYSAKTVVAGCLSLLVVAELSLAKEEYAVTTTLPGSCPKNLRYVKNIDIKRLQGFWYAPYYPANGTTLGCNGDCITFSAFKTTKRGLTVAVCCPKSNDLYCDEDLGSGSIVEDECTPGYFMYVNKGNSYPGFILELKYDSYWVGYVCQTNPDGSTTDNIYLFTRDRVLSPKVHEIATKAYARNGLCLDEGVRIRQEKECKYPWTKVCHNK